MIESAAVPCCNKLPSSEVATEVDVVVDVLGNVEVEEQDDDIGTRLMTEEVLLKLHLMDEEVVEGSLTRILQVENKITIKHLLESGITNILYNQVRDQYGVDCLAGRKVRRILKRIVSLGMDKTGIDNNQLPDITLVVEDNEEPAMKKRKFEDLFGKLRKQDSLILAEPGSTGRVIGEVDSIITAPNVFSTAMPEELSLLLKNIQEENLEELTECSEKQTKKRGRNNR